MMDGNAIQKIQDGYKPTALAEVEGRSVLFYKEGYKPYEFKPPSLEVLSISTLSGIAEYLNSLEDSSGLMVHIEDFDCVSVITDFDPKYKQRDCALIARFQRAKNYGVHGYIDLEEFIIYLMTGFEQTPAAKDLLKFLGSIQSEDIRQDEDDGISQKVTVKKGVASLGEAKVPNPVLLKPYLTFTEVKQPEIPFVFRMVKKPDQSKPSCMLVGVDDTTWKRNIIQDIMAFLRKHIPEDVTIIY